MAATNRAAWLLSKKAPSLVVKPAPYTPASANTIVIKNAAVAINPVDWLIPAKGDIMYGWLKYPTILGFDVAGEVVEVGEKVTRFQVGDRVLGLPCATNENVNDPTEGGFQNYVVLRPDLTSHIPSNMSYETAAVIPLCLSTAAAGLFQKDQLGLELPSSPPTPKGQTLLVWGGSTSVGCNAIQIGVAAGYEVFTTCSPKNFAYMKQLGASQVFDYSSKTVIPDIIAAYKGKTAAGALSMGHGGAEACMEVLDKVKGKKFVSMATYPMPQVDPQRLVLLQTAYGFVSWLVSYKIKGWRKGVKSNFIFASSVADNGVGKAMFVDFLDKALREGTFVAAPQPMVVGKGLDDIWKACEIQKKGVSAKKIVVSL